MEQMEMMLAPRLGKRKRDELERMIRDHFERNRPYLDPHYSLLRLADDLGICYQYVSFVINQCMGTTFKDLVNSYRVVYAKRLMEDEDADLYTLQWLSRQAGFGSRTTFFRAFQRIAGFPPSRYRQELRIN